MSEILTSQLSHFVAIDEDLGCERVDYSLGIHPMPDGYALMLDADRIYYYWMRSDGVQSVIHWDKWAVWRWAKMDKETPCLHE